MDSEVDDLPETVPEPPESAPEPPEAAPIPPPTARRRRLAFGPPFLLLSAAIALIGYRSSNPDWQGLAIFRRSRPRTATTPAPVAPPPASKPAPIVVKTVPEPTPSTTPADPGPPRVEIAAIEPPPRPEPVRPEANPGLPPVVAPVLASTPDPVPPLPPAADPVPPAPLAKPDPAIAEMNAQIENARKSRAVMDDILREAERKKIEREKFEALKPTVAANEEQEAKQKLFEGLKRAYEEAASDRVVFIEELRDTLARLGSRSGPAIQKLAERHRLSSHPVILAAVGEALKQHAGRVDRRRLIEIKRALGLPEESILNDLAVAEWKNHSARNGPRTEYEAIIRATRQILEVPIVPSSGRLPAVLLKKREVERPR